MKIFILPGVLAVAGLSVSCVHQVRTSGVYAAPAAEKTRQVPAFERQVANARDAGEGDYVVRRLRQQMASAPDNLGVPIQLIDPLPRSRYPELPLDPNPPATAAFP